MRKSTLFLSAALTTFMLAVLFGVASAYQNVVKSAQATSQPTAAAVAATVGLQPTAGAAALTPEQAADLAAKVLGRTDLYSVETADLNGVSTYLVTFSSGDLVYVSPQGQILSIVAATVTAVPPVVISGGAPRPAHRNNNGVTVSQPQPQQTQPPEPAPQPQPTQGGGGGGDDDGGGGGDDGGGGGGGGGGGNDD